jgi:hypothetical protein
MNEACQHFVQELMERKVVSITELEQMHAELQGHWGAGDVADDVAVLCKTCNDFLRGIGLAICGCTCRGEKYYALANKTKDALTTKHASSLEQWQVDVFRSIVTLLADLEINKDSPTDPTDLRREHVTNDKTLKKRSAGKSSDQMDLLLDRLVGDRWLDSCRAGSSVRLGPRSYIELAGLLRDGGMDPQELII